MFERVVKYFKDKKIKNSDAYKIHIIRKLLKNRCIWSRDYSLTILLDVKNKCIYKYDFNKIRGIGDFVTTINIKKHKLEDLIEIIGKDLKIIKDA
jgi:hypothetical protein